MDINPTEQKLINWLKHKRCIEIFDHMKNPKLIRKESSELDSILIKGELTVFGSTVINVILKIFFEPLKKVMNSVKVEEQIYRNIISNLIVNNHTPHLVKFYGTMPECKVTFSRLPRDDYEYFNNVMLPILRESYYPSNSNIMLFEYISGRTFNDFIVDYKVSEYDKKVAIFQILYTLECFNRKNLRHNDLHFINIFVEELKEEREIGYKFKEKTISIKSKVLARIYDFDRGAAYHPGVDRNLLIDLYFCEKYNQCNQISKETDLQSFLAGLLFKIRSYNLGKIEIWLDTLVSDRFKNITRGRDFAHVDKLSIFDPRDVRPLKHCLMSLLTIVDHKEIKDIKEIKNVYSLPPQSKIITGRSVSTKTHTLTTVYLGSALPLADIEAKFEYIFDIFSKSTLWKLWKRELLSLKYDVEKKSKEIIF